MIFSRGSRPLRGIVMLVCLLTLGSAALDEVDGKKKKPTREDLATQIWFDLALYNNELYTAGTRQLRIEDTSDPLKFTALDDLDFRETLKRIRFDDGRMFVAAGRHGLLLFEAAEERKDRWTFRARIDTPGNVLDFDVRENVVFLADGLGGLRIIDISNPIRPRRITQSSTRSTVRAVALQGDRLATAEGAAGVRVFRLRADLRADLMASQGDLGSANDVAWSGDTLLVAAGRSGVLLYRQERSRLTRMARLTGEGSAKYVISSPPYAFVSFGSAGIRIFDIHDPQAPRELARIDLPRGLEAGRMALHGDRLYFVMGAGGVGIVDISDRLFPRLLRPRERALNIEQIQD